MTFDSPYASRDSGRCIEILKSLVQKHIDEFIAMDLPAKETVAGEEIDLPPTTPSKRGVALGHILKLLSGMQKRYNGHNSTMINGAFVAALHEFELLELEDTAEHLSIADNDKVAVND